MMPAQPSGSQLGLRFTQRAPECANQRLSPKQRAIAFHERNPHVLDMIIRECRKLQRRGVKRWGMKAAFERMRWFYDLGVLRVAEGEPMLNNDFTATYADLAEQEAPDLIGFFEKRIRKSEAA